MSSSLTQSTAATQLADLQLIRSASAVIHERQASAIATTREIALDSRRHSAGDRELEARWNRDAEMEQEDREDRIEKALLWLAARSR